MDLQSTSITQLFSFPPVVFFTKIPGNVCELIYSQNVISLSLVQLLQTTRSHTLINSYPIHSGNKENMVQLKPAENMMN